MARLPVPGSDGGAWGTILNDFLSVSHDSGGALKANTVGSTQLQANAVTSTAIASNEISALHLATGSAPTTNQVLSYNGSALAWTTLPASGNALTTNPLSQFAATTSAQLAGVISDETGSGSLVFGTSPTLTTPNLGTPSAVNLTNATGLPISAITGSTAKGSILAASAANTLANVSVGTNGQVLTADSSQAAGVKWAGPTGVGPLMSGCYYYSSGNAASTSSALGNGSLRATPFVLPASTTLTRIGVEVNVVGQAGSLVRLGIYADAGGYPGSLIVDAGTVTGDSVAVKEITINTTIPAGVIWFASTVQEAATTQPTLYIISNPYQLVPLPAINLTSIPSMGAGARTCFIHSAAVTTGALPATFDPTTSGGLATRLFFKTA